uniref:Uncharacterized protein n=1 Tax=Amphimedon queenslandica TaxID=400682 RepID=A0A1X7TS46_AMPQE
MIDVSQWRASIGLWKNCQTRLASSSGSVSVEYHQPDQPIKRPTAYDSVSDIELNPGPQANQTYMKVEEVLRNHYKVLEDATKGSLKSILSLLYAGNIITPTVRDSNSYSDMMQEFEAKIKLAKDISELKILCEVFCNCLSQSGGPVCDAAESLKCEWEKVFDVPPSSSLDTDTVEKDLCDDSSKQTKDSIKGKVEKVLSNDSCKQTKDPPIKEKQNDVSDDSFDQTKDPKKEKVEKNLSDNSFDQTEEPKKEKVEKELSDDLSDQTKDPEKEKVEKELCDDFSDQTKDPKKEKGQFLYVYASLLNVIKIISLELFIYAYIAEKNISDDLSDERKEARGQFLQIITTKLYRLACNHLCQCSCSLAACMPEENKSSKYSYYLIAMPGNTPSEVPKSARLCMT